LAAPAAAVDAVAAGHRFAAPNASSDADALAKDLEAAGYPRI
jgi:hypothetical protein